MTSLTIFSAPRWALLCRYLHYLAHSFLFFFSLPFLLPTRIRRCVCKRAVNWPPNSERTIAQCRTVVPVRVSLQWLAVQGSTVGRLSESQLANWFYQKVPLFTSLIRSFREDGELSESGWIAHCANLSGNDCTREMCARSCESSLRLTSGQTCVCYHQWHLAMLSRFLPVSEKPFGCTLLQDCHQTFPSLQWLSFEDCFPFSS